MYTQFFFFFFPLQAQLIHILGIFGLPLHVEDMIGTSNKRKKQALTNKHSFQIIMNYFNSFEIINVLSLISTWHYQTINSKEYSNLINNIIQREFGNDFIQQYQNAINKLLYEKHTSCEHRNNYNCRKISNFYNHFLQIDTETKLLQFWQEMLKVKQWPSDAFHYYANKLVTKQFNYKHPDPMNFIQVLGKYSLILNIDEMDLKSESKQKTKDILIQKIKKINQSLPIEMRDYVDKSNDKHSILMATRFVNNIHDYKQQLQKNTTKQNDKDFVNKLIQSKIRTKRIRYLLMSMYDQTQHEVQQCNDDEFQSILATMLTKKGYWETKTTLSDFQRNVIHSEMLRLKWFESSTIIKRLQIAMAIIKRCDQIQNYDNKHRKQMNKNVISISECTINMMKKCKTTTLGATHFFVSCVKSHCPWLEQALQEQLQFLHTNIDNQFQQFCKTVMHLNCLTIRQKAHIQTFEESNFANYEA